MRPSFLFAPGAGAPSSHAWMQKWKGYLQSLGDVALFDFDYMREGRRRPDPLPRLVATHREALARFSESTSGQIFLIGKSMGGRIGCHVALEAKVAGLICLGYPLCAGGDRTKLRDKVLHELQTPSLFVQGTRDALCPLDLLEQVRFQMRAPNDLYIVEGGDHSLSLPRKQLKANRETQKSTDERILHAIGNFVSSTTSSLYRPPRA